MHDKYTYLGNFPAPNSKINEQNRSHRKEHKHQAYYAIPLIERYLNLKTTISREFE